MTKSPHTIVQWYAGFLSYSAPLVQGDELLKGGHRLIGGTDDLVAGVVDLLHPVGAPAHHAGHGEEGGVELLGDVQHPVDQARIEVQIGAERLGDAPGAVDDLGARRSTASTNSNSSSIPFSSARVLANCLRSLARGSERV